MTWIHNNSEAAEVGRLLNEGAAAKEKLQQIRQELLDYAEREYMSADDLVYNLWLTLDPR